jgi:hypothetical protein
MGVLYERSGIDRRGFVIADADGSQRFYPSEPGAPRPGTAARMAEFTALAADLALWRFTQVRATLWCKTLLLLCGGLASRGG